MYRLIITLMTVLIVNATGFAAASEANPVDAYRIGPGDVLYISIWKDQELTRSLPVLPDGTISFPLIGELQAAGRTVAQLKDEVAERIKPFVPDPVLTVSVQQVNSMLVYVVGRANDPGRLMLNSNVTALQAIAMAGGPNAFAKRDDIKILREKDGQTQIFEFPYNDIVKGEELGKNIRLERGDVIVIP